MMATEEALQRILAAPVQYSQETVPLRRVIGRILRQDVVAERDLPPFDRVTMDGIAIARASWERGQREFAIQAIQAAGEAAITLDRPADTCIQVMTGTPLAHGTDCIVPVEQLTLHDGIARIEGEAAPEPMQYIHRRASDNHAGDTLLHAGRRLRMQDIPVMAAVGLADVCVSACPSIAIVSTGDELVDGGQPILPHQTRMSLHHTLQGCLNHLGCDPVDAVHLRDDPAATEQRLGELLDTYDIVVICGGVSKGVFDFVPAALQALGVRMAFTKVAQRPGKPFRFGLAANDTPVFAFPGNPISALVCFHQYMLPFLARASGADPRPPEFAVLEEEIHFKPKLTFFAPVSLLSGVDGRVWARAIPYNTSGSMATLGKSDGFVELPADRDCFDAGTVVPIIRWQGPAA